MRVVRPIPIVILNTINKNDTPNSSIDEPLIGTSKSSLASVSVAAAQSLHKG